MFDEPCLKIDGYCVYENALNSEEITRARELLWNHIEEIYNGTDRNYPNSWGELRKSMTGFVDYSHQSEGCWFVRSAPGVIDAFGKIWNTQDLVTSMDTAIAWTPWKEGVKAPQTEGLHIDQTYGSFDAVQGMVVLYDVDEKSGGLEVIPGSHLKFEEVLQNVSLAWRRNYWDGNWGPLPHDIYPSGSGKLVKAKAGDLIMWDSRLIHGGKRGKGGTNPNQLARLAVTVCMQPRSALSQEVADLRKEGFQKGWSFNHHPTNPDIVTSSPFNYTPVQLSEDQKKLV